MIKTTLTEISRKRLVSVPTSILRPRIECSTRAAVQSHDARFAGSVFLIRIHPANAIDLALFVVHAFDEGPDGVSRKSRPLTLVDVRKVKTPPKWRGFNLYGCSNDRILRERNQAHPSFLILLRSPFNDDLLVEHQRSRYVVKALQEATNQETILRS